MAALLDMIVIVEIVIIYDAVDPGGLAQKFTSSDQLICLRGGILSARNDSF